MHPRPVSTLSSFAEKLHTDQDESSLLQYTEKIVNSKYLLLHHKGSHSCESVFHVSVDFCFTAINSLQQQEVHFALMYTIFAFPSKYLPGSVQIKENKNSYIQVEHLAYSHVYLNCISS